VTDGQTAMVKQYSALHTMHVEADEAANFFQIRSRVVAYTISGQAHAMCDALK